MSRHKRKIDMRFSLRLKHFFSSFTLQAATLVTLVVLMSALFVGSILEWSWMEAFIPSTGSLGEALKTFGAWSYLPLAIVGVPVIGALSQLLFGWRTCNSRDILVVLSSFITIALIFLSFPAVREAGLGVSLPGLLGLGLSFRIDMLGFIMLLITSFLWFLVMVYAHGYMLKERRCNRFFFFMALTYSAVLGTIVSGDLFTMFLFFEIMTFSSYILVVHGQKKESYEAGYNYIFMGILGGFAIFAGLLLLNYHVGDLAFVSALGELNEAGNVKYLIVGLLFLGFGIKAGMAPVHVWLPKAHPVAPTPASALLSGIMIKIGAFGMLRVGTSYYFPDASSLGDYAEVVWTTPASIGAVIIWVGIITMALGVFFALQQANIKRMLAYHSISQMGYILLGIGVAFYLGSEGAMGYTGALYHIINHALFKSVLFMVAGVVYLYTRESDMYNLGGLWKVMPLTFAIAVIAALGISGMPLFNGFASKSILHHAIVEAYEYGHWSFRYAEWLFMLVSMGTATSFIKLIYYVFLRSPQKPREPIYKVGYRSLHVPMALIAGVIILIGLFPSFLVHELFIPSMGRIAYDGYFIDHYIRDLEFFTLKEFTNTAIVMVGGAFIFFYGSRHNLFHLHLPHWLRLEFILFYPLNKIMRNACGRMGTKCNIDYTMMDSLEVRQNHDIGFIERFIITTDVFNRRYEKTLIRSDAVIYAVVLMGIVFLMVFF
ncbi:MAG: complex I subunit 5 family protein [Candidatus Izemoplasmataceae bacterium]